MSFPTDSYSRGSLPPRPLPDSRFLQEELQHPPSFTGSQSAPHSPSLNPSPLLNSPPLLSSPASVGASTARVTKRKSRADCKPPIRVLSADRVTFRDVVQKLTGIPTSPSIQGSCHHLWGAGNISGISRLLEARPEGLHDDLITAAHERSPTRSASSPYLSRGYSGISMVCNELEESRLVCEATYDPRVRLRDLSGGAILPWRHMQEGGEGDVNGYGEFVAAASSIGARERIERDATN